MICWEATDLPEEWPLSPPAGVFQSVTTGKRYGRYACGVRSDGGAVCWGGWTDALTPTGVFRSVSAGVRYVCGVLQDGDVQCWGVGDDDLPLPPDGKFVSIHSGEENVCGVRDDGTLACWNVFQSGTLPTPEGRFKSVDLDGRDSACGVRIDDTISCWVFDSRDEVDMLGAPQEKFISVGVEDNLACGISEGGDTICWALLSGCKLSADGSGCTPDANLKYVELTDEKFQEIFIIDTFTVCGLTLSGELVCGLRPG